VIDLDLYGEGALVKRAACLGKGDDDDPLVVLSAPTLE
jgi:hypothetical protein